MKQTKTFVHKTLKKLSFLILFLISSSPLLANELEDLDCPPLLQEIINLPEEQRQKRIYTQEPITWKDFTFTYRYPNPTINTLLAKWTNNESQISLPEPVERRNTIYMYSSHPYDIQRLWTECKKRGLLRDFFIAMVKDPRKFCTHEDFPSRTEFPPLKVSECACVNTGTYDRLITDRRHNFENEMIQALKKQCPQKNQTIRFMSLGCGDLLQETIFLGRLILEGYSSIEITLVDFWTEDRAFEALMDFFENNFPEIDITWCIAQTLSDLPQVAQFDLIYAIDFDDLFAAYETNELELYDCLNIFDSMYPERYSTQKKQIDKFRTGLGDIIEARSLLTPSGSLFLGAGGQDMRICSANALKLFHQDEWSEKEEALQSASLDSVHILTNIHHPDTVFSLIVTLLDKGCQSIELTMEERDYTRAINGEEVEDAYTYKTTSHLFMKTLFPQFTDKITVNLVDDIRPFIQGAHATFLDTDYIRGNLSEYSGSSHTVILNKVFEENP